MIGCIRKNGPLRVDRDKPVNGHSVPLFGSLINSGRPVEGDASKGLSE